MAEPLIFEAPTFEQVPISSLVSGLRPAAPTFASTGFANTFTDHPGGAPVVTFQAPDGIAITGPAFGSDNINTLAQAYPTPPFVAKGWFYLMQDWKVGETGSPTAGGDGFAGFAVRNAGGNIQCCGLLNTSFGTGNNDAEVFIINWTNPTTAATGPANVGTWSPQIALAVADDGTNLTYSYSLNPDAVQNDGYVWHQVYKVAKGSNFITTPNALCLFLSAHASAAELVMTRFHLRTGSATP